MLATMLHVTMMNYVCAERYRHSQAISVPLLRSEAAPLRRRRITGPLVVGSHLMVVGSPAWMLRPSLGMVNGFSSDDCAATAAIKVAAKERVAKCMLTLKNPDWINKTECDFSYICFVWGEKI